jgi:hypothetical protein
MPFYSIHLPKRKIQEFIDNGETYFGYTSPEPNIYMRGGLIMPPLSPQDLLKLSDRGIFQLLRYYQTHQIEIYLWVVDMVGGLGE